MKIKWVLMAYMLLWIPCIGDPFIYNISTQKVGLGEPIRVTLQTKSPMKAYQLKLNGKEFVFFLDEKKRRSYTYVAYVALDRLVKPDNYTLSIDAVCKNKKRFYSRDLIQLMYSKQKKKGRVALTTKAKKIASKKNSYQKEGNMIASKFKQNSKRKYFKDVFLKPTTGRVSSGFGKIRTYNNGNTSSHAGIDIANKLGTPVIASQSGKVILSKKLDVHGNTIMVDHGYGVVSIFCHLDKRLVRRGQLIRKGREIGLMGMTGVVSGVHLHWGMSVQNVRVNPLYFTTSKTDLI